MLKAVNISKTYHTKGGASQKALNKVSIDFDSTGLVFVLGKSGSGKSTLLNILGGLDKADEGEIIIKGKSSSEFSTGDFDSYRNTYLGFIFQDFNILQDFTVEENINLAHELQHKKLDGNKLNKILDEVEMLPYRHRKPNELSGGQIQRISIARALIKNPEIIMADEPTGSLDSDTGRQVFELLQKLGKDKLVIVVSHDRENAEKYADRIIEFKDGSIISDVTKIDRMHNIKDHGNLKVLKDRVLIREGSALSKEDVKEMNKAISKDKDINIQFVSLKEKEGFGSVSVASFVETDKLGELNYEAQAEGQSKLGKISSILNGKKTSNSYVIEKQKNKKDYKPFKLIKSKLPLYNAFKMGKSGLKHKKVKLFFTLFLTIVALTLFGFSDVVGNYTEAKASTNSFANTNYSILPFKGAEYEEEWDNWNTINPTEQQLQNFEEGTNYDAYMGYEYRIDLEDTISSESFLGHGFGYYTGDISGVIEMSSANDIEDDFEGTFPTNYNEIVINNYLLEHYIKYGFTYYDEDTDSLIDMETVNSFNDIRNKVIQIDEYDFTAQLKIVGMINYNLSSYKDYKETTDNLTGDSSDSYEIEYAMQGDVETFLSRIVVKEGFNEFYYYGSFENQILGDYALGYENRVRLDVTNVDSAVLESTNVSSMVEYGYQGVGLTIYSGAEAITSINDNEIIIPISYFPSAYSGNTIDYTKLDNYLNETVTFKIGTEDYNYETNEYDIDDFYIKNLKIVGFVETFNSYGSDASIIFSENVMDEIIHISNNRDYMYTYINNSISDKAMFEFMQEEGYKHSTSLSLEIYTMGSLFMLLQQVFFYISLILGIFVAFLILNFIATSISYKKKEIGILRALGARKPDVFKIFYFEGLIMGIIDYIISIILVYVGVELFNNSVKKTMSPNIVLVNVEIRQYLLMALVCFAVIFVASWLPIRKIANKKPIDAIRGH